ncbi:uncharacterized protein B0I36DRAFT_133537 [Microdochium trichocladiopsis]|uniref:Uncharacterized protein n=1 Tax=Microdochium trichocladiopsis TaxID=1682393 RepID=A0A9P9BPQ9_9PEZI|nr:uncharacterized protein B0I36DRAFT_133537 [Microdochium trichocladiopsis]KAH7029529.1 hypothetical protein B0I36DRAFT_133537 [Microdochium trichocladiopsis]
MYVVYVVRVVCVAAAPPRILPFPKFWFSGPPVMSMGVPRAVIRGFASLGRLAQVRVIWRFGSWPRNGRLDISTPRASPPPPSSSSLRFGQGAPLDLSSSSLCENLLGMLLVVLSCASDTPLVVPLKLRGCRVHVSQPDGNAYRSIVRDSI